MPILKPFKAWRPVKEKVSKVASRPYDVLNSEEARIEVQSNPDSFLKVVKPEVDLPGDIDIHSELVYNTGKKNLQKLISDKIFIQDNDFCYYIYSQTFKGKTQYGIVGCAGIDDYATGLIKKHELTRPDKEEDRMNHIRVTGFNAEPVFFAYPDNIELDIIVKAIIINKPEYSFTLEDSVTHSLWVVKDKPIVKQIENIFNNDIPCLYVADGHHRTAAAALVGMEKRKTNPAHKGDEEYNFFLSVNFPASQLNIIDYNRLIKDLNGLSPEEFLNSLTRSFNIELKGDNEYKPDFLHNFSMYLEGKWYSLTAKEGKYDNNNPIGVLDVTILTEQVLKPLLDISDLRTSTRIDFVGGIRGLGELKKRVDSGEMKLAFALYPASMKQLMDIADTGNIMPPKTTWFEPKLRSGLVLHEL